VKILYYNWVDYLDDERRGGGVTVYQKNLMGAIESDPDVDVWFLCSGISYDVFSTTPRWEQIRHGEKANRGRRFEIINSGVLAPSHHSFGSPAQLSHPETVAAFCDFVEPHGPFDVIHFQNLEGVPADVLTLKERWPETRIVFSLHNYYPFCPQVNFWHKETEHCADFREGRKCLNCLPQTHDERVIRQANAVAYTLKKRGIRPGTVIFDRGFGPAMRVARRAVRAYGQLKRNKAEADARTDAHALPIAPGTLRNFNDEAAAFAGRRAGIVALINRHCDLVLGVSDRVSQIARAHGVRPEIVQTSYIGTLHAQKYAETAPRPALPRADGTITLGFLGYMRADKGFLFLLDALEALPDEIAAKIGLVIAARSGGPKVMERVYDLIERFDSLSYADGYTHDSLDTILADVDVGLIPVLWEDNLPQVAIEMHARHIPLLTADKGGAQELGNCPDMVFPAGDEAAFQARLEDLLAGKLDLAAYWAGAQAPTSMDGHVAALKGLYARPEVVADVTPGAA
jgi:glycosyltransferase involved in cell wall biosynthesis